jgi:uncharacterized membrane protein YhaH (DUF805 family)
MLGSINYNLRHLLDFSGRDARQTFWYYVLFVVLFNFAVSLLVTIPVMIEAIGGVIASAQSGASPEAINAEMAGTMSGIMSTSIWASAALAIFNIALLAAAFVRRLHDSDRTGWWAAPVGVLHALAVLRTVSRVDEFEAMMREAIATGAGGANLYANNPDLALDSLLGWLPLLLMIGFGVLKSTDGPNRFAAEPVRF